MKIPVLKSILLAVTIASASIVASAQVSDSLFAPSALKRLSLEELMNTEVISVSKRPEKLTEVASAVQIITREDIIRSGATNLPEALRLAPNLLVSQINSRAWTITARGFNTIFSNKLLVLIDGRTVYSPLFAGIFWDAQLILLEDIERIEVISGPGGTLWGDNAVNGVINVITRDTKETKGLYVSAAAGSLLKTSVAARYGGNFGKKLSYRIYAQHIDYNNSFLYDTAARDYVTAGDASAFSMAGFRMDWEASEKSSLTLQGNFNLGTEYNPTGTSSLDGQNLLARWKRDLSKESQLIVQAYVDRTWRRDIPSTINDQLYTYDVDMQHGFSAGKRHRLLWGLGYRFMQNAMDASTPYVGFLPAYRNMSLLSSFIQDEIMLRPDQLKLTIGSKFSHNDFSGFEYQPSIRLGYTPDKVHTVWGAISRAIRRPSRIDVDYYIPLAPMPPNVPSVAGGPDFTSEKVIAYEAGYRVRPVEKLSLSVAGFFNQFNDLYSVEALPGTQTYQIQNGGKGKSWGGELFVNFQPAQQWRLRGGYTFFKKELKNKPGHNYDYTASGVDPEHQLLIQSILDLPSGFQLDVVGRHVSDLPQTAFGPAIAGHFNLDARIAWVHKHLELAVIGKSLLSEQQAEFGTNFIPRNVFGRVSWRM